MEYGLTPLFPPRGDRISLAREEYDQLRNAKAALVATIGVEQKFDLLFENYIEYERELLTLGLRLVTFRNGQWNAFQQDTLDVTRRIVNLLSAARLYIDQMSHDLSGLFGKSHNICTGAKRVGSAQYDTSFGYRLMEALRNVVQHRSLAGIRLKHHYGIDHTERPGDDPVAAAAKRRTVASVMPILSVSELHDMELKASVRREIEELGRDDLDLTLHVREYIDGLAAMHYEFRRLAAEQRTQWESILRQALASGRERWQDDRSNALNLIAVDSSGEVTQWTHLFPAFLDYLKSLETKNEGPLRLSRVYVSGRGEAELGS